MMHGHGMATSRGTQRKRSNKAKIQMEQRINADLQADRLRGTIYQRSFASSRGPRPHASFRKVSHVQVDEAVHAEPLVQMHGAHALSVIWVLWPCL